MKVFTNRSFLSLRLNGNALAAYSFVLAALLLIRIDADRYCSFGNCSLRFSPLFDALTLLTLRLFLSLTLIAPIYLVSSFNSRVGDRRKRRHRFVRPHFHLSTLFIGMLSCSVLLNPIIQQLSHPFRDFLGSIFLSVGVVILITDAWEYALRRRAGRKRTCDFPT